MSNELSIKADENETNLESNKSDHAAVALKIAVGNVPVVGSILSEVVGIVIPNQKSDRVKLFVEVLAEKLKYIEKDVLDVKMKTAEFTDLFKDALPQAARAMTNERREYIANFLKVSLTSDELNHLGEKKLLSILNELNDAEIIFLKYDALYPEEQNEFYEQHEEVLRPIGAHMQSPREEIEKEYLRESYQQKLLDLGLLKNYYKRVNKGEMPEMDEKTGTLKATRKEITGIGTMLLWYIDETFKDPNYPDED